MDMSEGAIITEQSVTEKTTLSDRALQLAEKVGLGTVAREAQTLWRLAGENKGDKDNYFSRLQTLPVASLVAINNGLLSNPDIGVGENTLDDLIKQLGGMLYPNPVTWRTVVGGAVGAVVASCGLKFNIEKTESDGAYETTRYMRGNLSLGGPLFGAIAGSTIANHFFEQHES